MIAMLRSSSGRDGFKPTGVVARMRAAAEAEAEAKHRALLEPAVPAEAERSATKDGVPPETETTESSLEVSESSPEGTKPRSTESTESMPTSNPGVARESETKVASGTS